MNCGRQRSWPLRVALSSLAAILTFTGSVYAADLAVLRNGFTIRHDHRQVIGSNTRLFFFTDDSSFTDVPTAEIGGFEKDLSTPPSASSATSSPRIAPSPQTRPQPQTSLPTRSAADLAQVVDSASATYHLDPDLVNSVIRAESGFNSHARSAKGAQGLMQLMPSTADALGVNNAFDPQANVGGGSRYLRELLERYNFDLVKALAAYNAGPKRVEQYKGVPPFRETRAYVNRIVRDYNRKKLAQDRTAAAKSRQEPAVAAKKTSATSAHKNPTVSARKLTPGQVSNPSPR
jgi:soluble lytic murein transglycosylase-like protein